MEITNILGGELFFGGGNLPASQLKIKIGKFERGAGAKLFLNKCG